MKFFLFIAPGLMILFCGCASDLPTPTYTVREIFADPKMAELATAAANGRIEQVDRLLTQGVPVDARGKWV